MCVSLQWSLSLYCYSFEEHIKNKGGGVWGVGCGVCIYIYIYGELRKEISVIIIFK